MSFLRKHGIKSKNLDVVQIIRRLDLDGDSRLCQEEFIRGLLPSEPYSKVLKAKKDKKKYDEANKYFHE